MSAKKWHCSKCNRDLPLSAFSVRKSGRRAGEPQAYCRTCMSAYDKARYRHPDGKTKQRLQKKRRDVLNRNRQFVLDYLAEHPCVDCGEDDLVVLEFDHQRDKVANICDLYRQRVSLKRLAAEMEKCEVCCANCHRRRTATEQGWLKGTGRRA